MVIREALKLVQPRRDAIYLMSKVLEVDTSYIYLNMDKELDEEDLKTFKEYIKLRDKNYPLQYILGSWDFMGLEFYLEEGVLIPRQDTEILVEYIIDFVEKNYKEMYISILDIGFGSGAIALSLAYYISKAQVLGIDIGEIPFKVARENKKRLNLDNVELIKGDLFKPLENSNRKFHIIVSNPPYISDKDMLGLSKEVKDYEPRLALAGGQDGLDFYKRIIPESKEYLSHQGLLILEIGYDQGDKTYNMMTKAGFKDVEVLKDYSGLDRVVLGFNG